MGRKVKAQHYALKGGVNLRFFFNSIRYSEDIDLDICGLEVGEVKDVILNMIRSPSFSENLKPFGIEKIIPPNIMKAKQTETTQRFKVHLMTFAGEDILTKIEFSRRGLKKGVVVEPVMDRILRTYKLPPLLVPHYDSQAAAAQKIEALALRKIVQARDIFDLYILSSQYRAGERVKVENGTSEKAQENVLEVSFGQFRDTVILYLSGDDRALYDSQKSWDEIKLKALNFIEELQKDHG